MSDSTHTDATPTVVLVHGAFVDAAYLTGFVEALGRPVVLVVPTITLEGDANGAPHPDPAAYAARFTGKYVHRTLTGGIGHNLPQEAPLNFVHAIEEVDNFA